MRGPFPFGAPKDWVKEGNQMGVVAEGNIRQQWGYYETKFPHDHGETCLVLGACGGVVQSPRVAPKRTT